ncbi:hypothetical protein chiPu_0003779 [Chiloscyllium punctatum]|uniref:Uncharacterized protein n=1 Tax=Chiloscyllium punctatum TaxID=137246 RepID=A0A401S4V0_CHIPU|nr:hypothetical protein [Chiloscyllium punctatum]
MPTHAEVIVPAENTAACPSNNVLSVAVACSYDKAVTLKKRRLVRHKSSSNKQAHHIPPIPEQAQTACIPQVYLFSEE